MVTVEPGSALPLTVGLEVFAVPFFSFSSFVSAGAEGVCVSTFILNSVLPGLVFPAASVAVVDKT